MHIHMHTYFFVHAYIHAKYIHTYIHTHIHRYYVYACVYMHIYLHEPRKALARGKTRATYESMRTTDPALHARTLAHVPVLT